MKKISTFQNRLKEVMKEQSINQAELLRRLEPIEKQAGIKIGKVNLSYYYNGINEPKNARLNILATALNVSSLWLEGYDVDKYELLLNLQNIFNNLNSEKKRVLLDYAKELVR